MKCIHFAKKIVCIVMTSASELAFQNEMTQQLITNGWRLGDPKGYNRKLALYDEDVLGFVKDTQDEQW